jgi:hypothetical protein
VAAVVVATAVARAATVASREDTAVAKVATVEARADTSRAVVSSCVAIEFLRTKLTRLTGYGGGNNWRGAPGGGYQGDQGTHTIFALVKDFC